MNLLFILRSVICYIFKFYISIVCLSNPIVIVPLTILMFPVIVVLGLLLSVYPTIEPSTQKT